MKQSSIPSGEKKRIKSKTVIAKIEHGELGLLDIKCKFRVLKVM